MDRGEIRDSALPGTLPHEAMRIVKNGVAVSSFACFETFVRDRTYELLQLISKSPNCPPFSHLPKELQAAATNGVIDALKFRLNPRLGLISGDDLVREAQIHAAYIAGTANPSFEFSPWTFGYSSSNIGAGTLTDFFASAGAPKLNNEFGRMLDLINYDYQAAGLTNEHGSFKLSKLFSWRHDAAHNSGLSLDVEVLQTRIHGYLAVALAFDCLASFAIKCLLDSFVTGLDYDPRVSDLDFAYLMFPVLDGSIAAEASGFIEPLTADVFSPANARSVLGDESVPSQGVVVVQGSTRIALDWFYL